MNEKKKLNLLFSFLSFITFWRILFVLLQMLDSEEFHCTLAPPQTRQKKHKHISQIFFDKKSTIRNHHTLDSPHRPFPSYQRLTLTFANHADRVS